MCGLPIPFWTLLITIVIVAAVVFKLRGWFKRGQPALEHLRDSGNDFVLFVVICLGMVFGAVSVVQVIAENNDKITAFFAAVREKCEPKEEQLTIEQAMERLRQQYKERP